VKETFIVDCTISDNKAASGGGICALDSGEITLINTAICNNTAANAGGIVMTYTGDLPTVASKFFLTDCKISGNTSSHGTLLEHNAAVIVKGSEVHVKSSDLSQNNTRGLTILDANEASVIESVISKNTYGGVLVASSARIAIHDSTISENDSAYHGAGVCVYNTGSFTMTGSTIAENTTNWHGGGIYVNFEHQFNSKNSFYTVVDISNSDICNNSSAKLGGGIYLSPLKDITITSSRICGNTAEHGGGVYAQEAGRAGVLTVAGSIVSGNRASADGGGLWIRSLNFTLTGNTITNNTSFYKGGGIYTTSSSTITMTDNIISNNSSEQSLGGGLWVGYLVRIKDSQGNILEVPTEVKAINTFFDNTPDDISFY
jgi:parallel beta-helix repeat protein